MLRSFYVFPKIADAHKDGRPRKPSGVLWLLGGPLFLFYTPFNEGNKPFKTKGGKMKNWEIVAELDNAQGAILEFIHALDCIETDEGRRNLPNLNQEILHYIKIEAAHLSHLTNALATELNASEGLED